MTNKERETIKAEIREELIHEIAQQKRSRSAVRQMLDEFETDFEKFDRVGWNGQPVKESWKIRSAISTLVRLHYGCQCTDKVPIEALQDARRMIQTILDTCKPKEVRS